MQCEQSFLRNGSGVHFTSSIIQLLSLLILLDPALCFVKLLDHFHGPEPWQESGV
jgi:hypothetical protein